MVPPASCHICPANASFAISGYPFCQKHGKEYKESSRRCHLTDFNGRGRAQWNMELLKYCSHLHAYFSVEMLKKTLHQHSHKFSGEVETQRRVKHVQRFFKGIFDNRHICHCKRIAKKIPIRMYGTIQNDIIMACLEEEAKVNQNSGFTVAHD